MGKVKPKDLILEYYEIKNSNDSSRSKPNRYRIIVEKALKYVMDIDEDELHSLGVLVDRYRDYPMTYSSGQNSRARSIVSFCNKWSHSTSETLQEDELRSIESQLKEFLDKIFNLDIQKIYENNKGSKTNNSKSRNTPVSQLKQRPNKTKLLNVIYNTTGIRVDKLNFNLSTINKNGIYSVEPNWKRPYSEWFLILINTQTMRVYLFQIPAHSNIYKNLYRREEKEVFRSIFNLGDDQFTDTLSGVRFDQFLTSSFKLENPEIFS